MARDLRRPIATLRLAVSTQSKTTQFRPRTEQSSSSRYDTHTLHSSAAPTTGTKPVMRSDRIDPAVIDTYLPSEPAARGPTDEGQDSCSGVHASVVCAGLIIGGLSLAFFSLLVYLFINRVRPISIDMAITKPSGLSLATNPPPSTPTWHHRGVMARAST